MNVPTELEASTFSMEHQEGEKNHIVLWHAILDTSNLAFESNISGSCSRDEIMFQKSLKNFWKSDAITQIIPLQKKRKEKNLLRIHCDIGFGE